MARCTAIRTDGERCKAAAVQDGSGQCFWHNPRMHSQHLEAAAMGGRNRRHRVQLPEAEPLTPEGARAILAATIEAVACGSVDDRSARTIGYLLTIDAKLLETGELEKRIASLERMASTSTQKQENADGKTKNKTG